MLEQIGKSANDLAVRHVERLATCAQNPDALECLWSIQGSLTMMHSSDAGEDVEPADAGAILTHRAFETLHTQQVLFVLRTYGLLIRLADLILIEHPDNAPAISARSEAKQALRAEIAAIEARTHLVPVSLDVVTGFQMRSIFICADALAAPDSGV